MDRIWAPWRMEYIKEVDKNRCFLCEAISNKDDRKDLILYRGKEVLVIMNRYPYNCGHLMAVPYKHTPDVLSLKAACRDEIMELCGKAMQILTQCLKSEGFNCGMNFGDVAGVGLKDHFHMHIVPRWMGDVNFFPVLGDTKSMPEYLEQTYDDLIGAFKEI